MNSSKNRGNVNTGNLFNLPDLEVEKEPENEKERLEKDLRILQGQIELNNRNFDKNDAEVMNEWLEKRIRIIGNQLEKLKINEEFGVEREGPYCANCGQHHFGGPESCPAKEEI